MLGQSLIYSNARVKAMENGLLNGEKITRMAHSESLAEAIKILYESNYGNGNMVDNPFNYQDILRAEENKIAGFLVEAMPNKSGLETFLSVNDYHNAKAYLKAKFSKIENVNDLLLPEGNIKLEVIAESVEKEDYAKLPSAMANAIKDVENRSKNDEITPRMIDVVLDRAMFNDIIATCKKINVKSITKYWTSYIDFVNVSTMIRCKQIQADIKFLKENLIDGGEINNYILEKLYKENFDTIAEKLRYTSIGEIIAVGINEAKQGKALIEYEVLWDNYLLEIFKADKADIFSVAPIAGFYIAKQIELKMVRMILTCLKNQAGIDKIKARLRGFYA